MDDVSARIWENLLGRLDGPLHLRFLLQPAMALAFGIRDGLRDARVRAPPYLWAIIARRSQSRALLRQGWKAVAKVFTFALLIDAVYQLSVFKFFYPGEALVVAFLLAMLPYLLVRGPANWLAGAFAAGRRSD